MGISAVQAKHIQAVPLVLQQTEEAMYEAKRTGKDRLAIREKDPLRFAFYK